MCDTDCDADLSAANPNAVWWAEFLADRRTRSRWLEKQQSGGFQFLEQVVDTIDVIKAIILTRQKQIQPFLVPERKQGPCGFHFVRVDGAKLTAADARQITRLERFLVNGCDEPDENKHHRLCRPKLVDFVKCLLCDTLAYDAAPIELTSGCPSPQAHALSTASLMTVW